MKRYLSVKLVASEAMVLGQKTMSITLCNLARVLLMFLERIPKYKIIAQRHFQWNEKEPQQLRDNLKCWTIIKILEN